MKIVISPNPILNTVCEPCEPGDPELKKLSKQMFKAMYKNNGVGLAAPQVGVLKRIITVDCGPEDDPDPMTLVNPEVVNAFGADETEEEGCLSCPGISVPITRKAEVVVRYYDLEGEYWELEADGLLARCLQHEIDHLNGITLFEAAAPRDRIKALAAYEDALREGAKPGETSSPKVR